MFRHSQVYTVILLVLPLVFGNSCLHEPPNLHRMIQDFQSGTWHDSMNNLPDIRFGFPVGPDDIDQSYVGIQRSPYTTSQCPLNPNATNPELNARTTCPVHWLINTDPNRIPVHLAEVKCSCGHCLNSDSDGRQTDNVCEPVYYCVKALRRVGCQGEFFRYARVNEKLQLACTCAQQYVRNSVGGGPDGPFPSN